MKMSRSVLPYPRTLILLVFIVMCLGLFGYLWVNSGGRIPLVSQKGYTATVDFAGVSNLVDDADVTVAGVKVGSVQEVKALRQGGGASVTMELHDYAPLHEGATVQVRKKTLIEETYLEIIDGTGQALPTGSRLPDTAGKEAVELDDVLSSIDRPTREALGSMLRSLGSGTKDTRAGISQTLQGLGDLGREGHDAVSALSGQSNALAQLTGNTSRLLAALDTRQGQIAQLVQDSDALTRATADSDTEIRSVMRQLPGLLATTQTASGSLGRLSDALTPVARDVNAAAPDLNKALLELPATSKDLRGLLPPLEGVLDDAPGTLRRVPAVADHAQRFLPTVNVALSDLNPMLSYLVPYGRDVAAFFTNIGQVTARSDANGHYIRLMMVYNEHSLRGKPVSTEEIGPLRKNNPYPRPGQAKDPAPFSGKYHRVERDPPK